MFYTFPHTLTADESEDAPAEIELTLSAGVIHQVDVLFQDGCDHEIFVQIYLADLQLWPSNRGESLRGNATVVSFREFYTVVSGNSILTARFWSTLGSSWKEVIIQIGLLPKVVLQPLSFEELLSAATGVE
ncbi:hypothetical protein LCGC14_0811770 [marine sediment metagenome]|uniref:Uncharacterized protein n=1 Tax=marine sediment metagenome TaxID=412755 RepID=A0A0F9PR11_9ZZZZ